MWEAVDVQPSGGKESPAYQAFSSDLSVGILRSQESLLPTVPEEYEDLYVHSTGEGGGGIYAPVFTSTPRNRAAAAPEVGFNESLLYAGMSGATGEAPGAATHVLFEASDVVLEGEGALVSELDAKVKASVEERSAGRFDRILYDFTGGAIDVVNVLPNGKADVNASFGSFPTGRPGGPPGLSHAISNDGSRIFWTDGVTKDLYVREDGGTPAAKTVQVDARESGCGACAEGGGRFLTASGDGARAFFTDESRLTSDSTAETGEPDLYEYDVDTAHLTDLTVDANAGEHANVQGVLGSSEDGSYLYFVAQGLLAGNTNGNGETAEVGQKNVYLRHGGATSFIAMLSSADGNEVVPFDGNSESFESGDWEAAPGFRTAQVTPDGHSLIFMSNRRLTGYDNEQTAFNPFERKVNTTPLDEVFLYEAETNTLRCVSCDPTGAAPVPSEFNDYRPSFGTPVGGFIPITKVNGFRAQPRVISEDGSRVFFDSGEPLVSEDTNGWLSVYEWERSGSGSCTQPEGCVYLLSSGGDPESSYLIGASSSGADAFFVTRAQLVTADQNENDDLYDVHECTSVAPCAQETAAPRCAGSGCETPAPEAPTFGSRGSLTFSGVGDYPPASPPPPVKCKKGFTSKGGKCVRRPVKCKKGFAKKRGRCVRLKRKGRQARKPTISRGKHNS